MILVIILSGGGTSGILMANVVVFLSTLLARRMPPSILKETSYLEMTPFGFSGGSQATSTMGKEGWTERLNTGPGTTGDHIDISLGLSCQ